MSDKTKALLLNMLAILCWAISPVAIRYVKEVFSVNVQNFFRYLVSLAIIWPVFFLSNPRSRTQNTFQTLPSILPKLLIMACIVYVFQLSFTYSFFLIYPGFGSLIYKTGIVFSVLLAAVLFPDERKTLKSWKFQWGLSLAFIGVVLTIAGGKDWGKVEFNLGVLLILTAAASWSLLTALIKKWFSTIPASFSVSMVLTIVTPFYLLTDMVINRGLRLPDASVYMWILMIVSGIIGVGLAHTFYYYSVPFLGVALCASLDLTRPFLAGIISFLMFGESLTLLQIAGGILLLTGSYLVIKSRFQYIT